MALGKLGKISSLAAVNPVISDGGEAKSWTAKVESSQIAFGQTASVNAVCYS